MLYRKLELCVCLLGCQIPCRLEHSNGNLDPQIQVRSTYCSSKCKVEGKYLVCRVSCINSEHCDRTHAFDDPMRQSTRAKQCAETSDRPLLDRIHLITLELDAILINFETRLSSNPELPDVILAHPCCSCIEHRAWHDGSCRAGA